MSDDDIDLDRVLVDPVYRRRVIEYLNAAAANSPEQATPHSRASESPAVNLPRS